MRALRQIKEISSTITTSVGDSASVAQASGTTPLISSKNVRRVETVIFDEDEEDNAVGYVRMVGIETYDLTYSDNMKIGSCSKIQVKAKRSSFCGF